MGNLYFDAIITVMNRDLTRYPVTVAKRSDEFYNSINGMAEWTPRWGKFSSQTFQCTDTQILIPNDTIGAGAAWIHPFAFNYMSVKFRSKGEIQQPEYPENNYYYYYIDDIQPYPNGWLATIRLDYWATYYLSAKIQVNRITRTNRCRPDYYKAIIDQENTNSFIKREFVSFYPATTERQRGVFVAQIQYKVKNAIGTDIKTVQCFYFNLEDNNRDYYQKLLLIQNIYQNRDLQTEATILGIWICPLIRHVAGLEMHQFTTRNDDGREWIVDGYVAGNTDGIGQVEAGAFAPGGLSETIINSYSAKKVDYIPNCALYLGTKANPVKINNIVSLIVYKIFYRITADGINVILRADNNEYDITDSFKLPNIGNNTLMPSQFITAAIGRLTSIVAGGAQIASGTPAGVIGGAAQLIGGITQPLTPSNTNYQGGENGLALLSDLIQNGTWFYLQYDTLQNDSGSASDVQYDNNSKYIRDHGAIVDIVGVEWDDIINSPNWLPKEKNIDYGKLTYNIPFPEMYIQADCTITNVPRSEQIEMEQAIANGICIKRL